MFIDGINFPNEIIEAIRKNNFVVFAGAGASVDAPTSLPDFVDLAKKIAEGTGEILKEDDTCEAFLGYLKSKSIDVNKQAAELLSGTCLKHNQTHEAIIDLFADPSKIKIITTNYDQMFEQVLESRGLSVSAYNAPALPLGNDVDGIIHVHGNINNPKYMVLTDEDFGKAYLTEGYAARFLIKLFQSYTILFIGYSYRDTILRYLTRAMDRLPEKTRFILTDEEQSDWKLLGLTPIYFPSKNYGKMREGLIKLGQRAKRGLLDWDNMIKEFKSEPPRDIALDTEIDYCLDSVERSRVLANNIHGKEWILALNEKGVFDNLFMPEAVLSEKDQIWMQWIVDECLGKENETFKILYLNNGNKIHFQFASLILRKLELGNDSIPDVVYKEYIIVLDSYITDSWTILRLIEILSKRGMYSLCYKLFVKYFEVQFVFKNNAFGSKDGIAYKHRFRGEQCQIEESWKRCKEQFLNSYAEQFLYFVKETILNLHNTYLLLNGEDKPEPWEMAMLVIEDREDYSRQNPLYFLCTIFCESCKLLECKHPERMKAFLESCLSESSALLKKLCLKALRECERISSCDKFDIFINNSSISFFEGKEQIFLLIEKIFNDLTEDKQKKLIDEIEALDTHVSEYPIYNWCVWIKKFCSTNDRINELEKEILSRNHFESRQHPERDIDMGEAVWSGDQSPITQEQMLESDLQQLVDLLNNYNEDPFEGPTRWGMLKTFSECIKSDYEWTSKIIKIFIDGCIEKEDAWQRLLIGIQDSNFKVDQLIALIDRFAAKMEIVKDICGLSEIFLKIVKSEETKKRFITIENKLFGIADTIWNYRQEDFVQSDRLIETAMNTGLGNILRSSIYMLSYCDETQGIPERYKSFWEKNLLLEGKEKNIVLCILAGYFNFLYLRDQEWCTDKFAEILSGIDQQSFVAAWEGIVYFSRYLNKDVADVMGPIYLRAVKNLNWLEGEARRGFIDLYLLLLIYVVEDPCLEYIPRFYDIAEEQDLELFIQEMGYRLGDMDDNGKKVLWTGWLKQYLTYRYENKPTMLTEKEKELFLSWLPELGQLFEEAVNIICKDKMAQHIDALSLRRLDKSKLVLQYPHPMIRLLTKMLNDGTKFDYYGEYLGNIYRECKGISQEEEKEFQEALLKRGMSI